MACRGEVSLSADAFIFSSNLSEARTSSCAIFRQRSDQTGIVDDEAVDVNGSKEGVEMRAEIMTRRSTLLLGRYLLR